MKTERKKETFPSTSKRMRLRRGEIRLNGLKDAQRQFRKEEIGDKTSRSPNLSPISSSSCRFTRTSQSQCVLLSNAYHAATSVCVDSLYRSAYDVIISNEEKKTDWLLETLNEKRQICRFACVLCIPIGQRNENTEKTSKTFWRHWQIA